MGVTFAPFKVDACCLCGAADDLTGEHKIKASALRAEFGGANMLIGRFGEADAPMRLARGPKSKALHFAARLCGACNSARTQPADLEFDRFIELASKRQARGEDPADVFLADRYASGSVPYLNVFRYFAKLMCCHMADIGAPRRLHMARFAMGLTDRNCIWLKVDEDWNYSQLSESFGIDQYASHGGLVIYASKKTQAANAIHSTLTVGRLRCAFHSRFTWVEQLELRLSHRAFFDRCRQAAVEALADPVNEAERLALGL